MANVPPGTHAMSGEGGGDGAATGAWICSAMAAIILWLPQAVAAANQNPPKTGEDGV
jgi:hypothetical protein